MEKATGKNYDDAQQEYDRLIDESQNWTRSIYEMEQFVSSLKEQAGVIAEYDYGLMKQTVKQIKIYQDGRAAVEFVNKSEITVKILAGIKAPAFFLLKGKIWVKL